MQTEFPLKLCHFLSLLYYCTATKWVVIRRKRVEAIIMLHPAGVSVLITMRVAGPQLAAAHLNMAELKNGSKCDTVDSDLERYVSMPYQWHVSIGWHFRY